MLLLSLPRLQSLPQDCCWHCGCQLLLRRWLTSVLSWPDLHSNTRAVAVFMTGVCAVSATASTTPQVAAPPVVAAVCDAGVAAVSNVMATLCSGPCWRLLLLLLLLSTAELSVAATVKVAHVSAGMATLRRLTTAHLPSCIYFFSRSL